MMAIWAWFSSRLDGIRFVAVCARHPSDEASYVPRNGGVSNEGPNDFGN